MSHGGTSTGGGGDSGGSDGIGRYGTVGRHAEIRTILCLFFSTGADVESL